VNFLWLWAPVILQMAVIFGVSSLSNPSLPAYVSDKAAHGTGYAMLSFLVIRAMTGGRFDATTVRRALVAVVVSALYGASDEFHQQFVPGRTSDLLDLRADAFGACLGVIVWYALRLAGIAASRVRASLRQ
jgi:VanZ family protein